MLNKFPFISLITISMLSLLLITACGRTIITGRVVDAQINQPLENAAVFIYWSESGFGPPGLGGSSKVEVAEDLTDAQGSFQVPKYSTLLKDYRMAVYKKGYVCWSNEDIFPTLEERKNFKLKNGMIIKLERFKEEYSKKRHASYTLTSSTGRPAPGIFNDAIRSELDIFFGRQQKEE